MSSSSVPVKVSATGASSVDAGRQGNVDGDSLLRRSVRLASKSAPPTPSLSRTPSEEVAAGSKSATSTRAKSKRQKKELTTAVETERTATVIPAVRKSARSTSGKKPKTLLKAPVKRPLSAAEDSDEEEVETDHKLDNLTTRSKDLNTGSATKSSCMGAVQHKAEAGSVSSSNEEDAAPSEPAAGKSKAKVNKSKPEVDATGGVEGGDTIANRVLRDRRKSTKSFSLSETITKRAPTPVPSAASGVASKSKKEKEKRTVQKTVSSKGARSAAKDSKGPSETAPTDPSVTTISAGNMAQNNANRAAANDPTGLANNIFTALGDLDSFTGDDFDVNRLQALLEARGLPSSLFSNLGPRFQQMLGRIGSQGGGSTQCYNKCTQLLVNLKGNDDSAQLAAASELCQMLVMGNEDTLHGFPIKQAVAALTAVIGGEGNFELVTQACRALSYMMESLPRSSAVVTGAIPTFLEKLQSIEYIDVAEQSLVALEMLSRRHAKQILRANGVQAVLNYIEFFSATAQRNALMITACCCSNLTPEEFEFVQPVLPLLSQRISHDNDKKSVENTCAAFSRIVDCFHNDADRLREIASHGLLQNIQQLLVVSPSILSSQTFIMVIQMLTHICTACPDLSAHLLDNKITETLATLLTGSPMVGNHVELSKSARSPQEGYELIRLIVALLPDLPSDGIFAVEDLLRKVSGNSDQNVVWFWKDDGNAWVPYTNAESISIENAFRTNQEDILLDTPQAQYVIDLVAMHQINEDTGTSREVRRQELPPVNKNVRPVGGNATPSADPNVAVFIRSIFGVLYEVYSTSAGSAIRHKCSEALLKMTYHASADLLTAVMQKLPVSSNIASNLANGDLKSVIYAIQLADMLMQKLPQTFNVHFRREGVVYQMNLCAKGESVVFKNQSVELVGPGCGALDSDLLVIPAPAEIPQSSSSAPQVATSSHSTDSSGESSGPAAARTRVQPGRRQSTKRGTWHGPGRPRTAVRSTDALSSSEATSNSSLISCPSSMEQPPPPPPLLQTTANPNPTINRIAMARVRSIANEGRAMFDRLSSSLSAQVAQPSSTPVPPMPVNSHLYRQQAWEWIKNQAQKFLIAYFPMLSSSQSGSLAVLVAAVEKLRTEKELSALKEIKQVILDGNASPFEVIHSNVISTLLKYLTEPEWLDDFESSLVVKRVKRKAKYETNGTPRRLRLMRFMHVFFDCPSEEEVESNFVNVFDISDCIDSVPAFQALVAKLNACINQLEQFPVRVTDLTSPGMVGLGTAGRHPIMRAFAHSQLKCTLSRHADSPTIRQWRGGMVRVEPLAPIYTIERYLVTRGCAKIQSPEENALDTDEVSDEEEIDSMSMAADAARSSGRYRLELLYNDNVLPYNWSLYQCIRHFIRAHNGEETDGDSDFGAGQMALFTNTHTIHYRLVNEENAAHQNNPAGGTPAEPGTISKTEEGSRNAGSWETGILPVVESTLESFLSFKMPDYVTVHDPALDLITLLRVLFGLNYHWSEVYQPQAKLLPHLGELDFLNNKLVTKMIRQLQDPMMVLTGQMPLWMAQIAVYAPFLFPFEARLQLFYVTAFDRDRAMQRLLDANPELAASRNSSQTHSSSSHDHITPRIERRKRTVSRKNLLTQTQTIMDEYAQCRQFLEIQYQDEVGTGLGPTLEFYSLVSKEFQRSDLNLWHAPTDHRTTGVYAYSPCGLFPRPLSRSTPKSRVTEVEGKFRLLGKFMAKAVMDFRMADIPFSPVFYKWLLGHETRLGLADLAMIDPEIAKHVEKLHRIARRKKWLESGDESEDRKRGGADDDLLYDGTRVEDLTLSFTLPGYEDIELCKAGSDTMVTLENLENYVNLVAHYYLREGVSRQLESFRDAFNAIIPIKYIQLFRGEEMDAVFCGHGEHLEEGWDVKTLMDTCHPDHGFTRDSQAVKWLYTVMSKYNAEERREFVQFVTGSPKLPVGGFKALNPPFTVVRKTFAGEQNPDQFLPSVMTCVNYLKLPDYSSLDVMKKRLDTACKEGQHSFHLS